MGVKMGISNQTIIVHTRVTFWSKITFHGRLKNAWKKHNWCKYEPGYLISVPVKNKLIKPVNKTRRYVSGAARVAFIAKPSIGNEEADACSKQAAAITDDAP